MAYILGFFAADGYITINRRGGQFWCFQIADKKLLKQIKSIIKADHKISARKTNNNTLYRLQIGSIEMCSDLRKLGFSKNKTKSLSVPHIPEKYFSHFVRGYFDGDGSVWVGYVHKERASALLAIRSVFTSCSGEVLGALRQKLDKVGVDKGVLSNHKSNYHRLTYSIYGSLKLYDFMYNHKTRSLKNKLFLERKKRVFDQ